MPDTAIDAEWVDRRVVHLNEIGQALESVKAAMVRRDYAGVAQSLDRVEALLIALSDPTVIFIRGK